MEYKFKQLVSGELTDSEAEDVQTELVMHAEDASTEKMLEEFFDSLDDGCTDSAMASEALCQINSRLKGERRRVRADGLSRWTMRLAAALCLPFAGLSIYMATQSGKHQTWSERFVPFGTTEELVLSDGTKLTLNSGSRITYPDHFMGKERRIFVDGEVIADVTQDEDCPFIIESKNIEVKVLGTKFDFKYYFNDANAELMLFEGSVNLKADADSLVHEVIIHPGEFATYDKITGELNIRKVDEKSYKPFSDNGSMHFFNSRLSDVAKELERRFGIRFIITDANLANTHYYAYFTNGESLDEILLTLNADKRMHIRKTDEAIYLMDR